MHGMSYDCVKAPPALMRARVCRMRFRCHVIVFLQFVTWHKQAARPKFEHEHSAEMRRDIYD